MTSSTAPPPVPTSAGSYTAAAESLRSAAKWLLAAASGVAALLVAGLQLSSLGDLASKDVPRFCIALGGLLLALLGFGAVVWRAGALLSDEWITLTQLSDADWRARVSKRSRWARTRRRLARGKVDPNDITTIFDELGTYRDELYGNLAHSVGDLYDKLVAANADARAQAAKTTPPNTEERRSGRHAELRAAARDVVEFANYRRTRANFDRLRRTLVVAGAAVVIGLVTFAVSTHQPETSKAPPPSGQSTQPSAPTHASTENPHP
jgi:hypothetical protein